MMIGISNDTFGAWKNGEYRKGTGELGSSHNRTVKKWMQECELSLLDGATEQNSIGCIFGLKANYGYTEAPQQFQFIGQDNRKTLEQIAEEHRMRSTQADAKGIARTPDADF